MADSIGFYNSHYTGGEIDAAVGQTKQNEDDIKAIKTDIAANQNEISSLKENLETNTNNISNLNGIVAQQSTALNELQAAIKTTFKHTVIAQRADGSTGWNGMAYFVAYSTYNLNINSVTNLKTVLGNNFIQPCNGYMKEASDETNLCELITSSGFMIRTPTAVSYDTIDFSNTIFSDTVTPI